MHSGHYVFSQITKFLPKRYFERLTVKYDDRTRGWSLSHWSHLLVLMFGQLLGCRSLRELTDITVAHANKSFFLGFGRGAVNRQMLAKANSIRDYRIFEEFAFHMVAIAQSKRLTREFELHGRFYAVDSTTIDLCLSVFRWAKFRTTKSGIRIHTQIDIVTEIPVFYRITNAQVHDVNSMNWLTYEPLACYVFDRGYFDLARLYEINCSGAFFIIREKFHPALLNIIPNLSNIADASVTLTFDYTGTLLHDNLLNKDYLQLDGKTNGNLTVKIIGVPVTCPITGTSIGRVNRQ